MDKVDLSPVRKELAKLPTHVKEKLLYWINHVEAYGIEKMRSIPGFNDEALKGKRTGQRSIRLNKAYRAIYTENKQGNFVLIRIEEVNKHDY